MVSSGSAYPGIMNLNDMLFYAEGKSTNENVDVHFSAVEKDYLETLGFQLLSGRSFSNNFKNDSSSIILNQTAIKELGYTDQNAVGKTIRYDVGNFHGSMNIVGVVKDFNYESLHDPIRSFGFTTTAFGNRFGFLVASITADNYAAVITKINAAWSKLNPSVPFEYSFIDQDFEQNYQKEKHMSGLVSGFTIIAILIAALGLFGLSAFSAEQRTREIGIRKVLGASVDRIVVLLSKDFVQLVGIAVLISFPISWWAMNKWLADFAYRTHISWWMFLLAGIIALFIAVLTVSFQAIKAAIANPVKSMRAQ
jgi:putative ABC transport system permease protein